MEGIYKMIYFLVSGAKAYKEDGLGFHTEFFINNNGILFSLLLAFAIAALIALGFYFGLCMKKETYSYARTSNWWIAIVLAAVCTFFVNDLLFVGKPVTNQNATEKGLCTYYKSNEKLVKAKGYDEQYVTKKDELNKQIKNWKDVRMQYNLNAALWCLIFFVGVSLAVKGLTSTGNCIPCKWPTK